MIVPPHLIADSIFGQLPEPSPLQAFSGGTGLGLVPFINTMLKVITVVAGLFGAFNIISAGFTWLGSSGNPKAAEEANNKLLYSLIGLIIIVGSFTITAIVSFLLFGDATFILNPHIQGVGKLGP
ncbi:hypothetical protein C5B42_01850 [Candidatus Cerribacteria bacterium 'Amazon FNV 2010 28 9']|uniref:Uncharacterized protein n=1 Tax=Candidatus Cerribacteria bacterium 'Amazon FNV 2010 28 9' TaxID=2081795 RepID=A0A317JQR5_9BACT|nr:MAG: hypothetical protein C5B42_01850 [Candidatus Cerribacteria bacterium 'Amazon FNV 2010 28 9']